VFPGHQRWRLENGSGHIYNDIYGSRISFGERRLIGDIVRGHRCCGPSNPQRRDWLKLLDEVGYMRICSGPGEPMLMSPVEEDKVVPPNAIIRVQNAGTVGCNGFYGLLTSSAAPDMDECQEIDKSHSYHKLDVYGQGDPSLWLKWNDSDGGKWSLQGRYEHDGAPDHYQREGRKAAWKATSGKLPCPTVEFV